MKRYTPETIPNDAAYLGTTEGRDTLSEYLSDLIADAIDPAYIQEPDGSRSFFDLCPTN